MPQDGRVQDVTISAKKVSFEDERSAEEIEVHYMVGRSVEEDDIRIDYDDMEPLCIEAALLVADAIYEIEKWRKTPAGIKKIAQMRKKENKDE
jgi:hypothetical protein